MGTLVVATIIVSLGRGAQALSYILYLWVYINSKLIWSDHCKVTASKAMLNIFIELAICMIMIVMAEKPVYAHSIVLVYIHTIK